MSEADNKPLSRRQRQIMDIVYRCEGAAVGEVVDALPDPPSYSTIRALMTVLTQKGHLKRKKQGLRYVYLPTQSRKVASRSALKRVLSTFFDGSVDKAVAALIEVSDTTLPDAEMAKLEKMIIKAGKGGR